MATPHKIAVVPGGRIGQESIPVTSVLDDAILPRDLGETAGTREIADAVVERLNGTKRSLANAADH